MKKQLIIVVIGFALFFSMNGFAEADGSTGKYHAVIIQGAGYLPDKKKTGRGNRRNYPCHNKRDKHLYSD